MKQGDWQGLESVRNKDSVCVGGVPYTRPLVEETLYFALGVKVIKGPCLSPDFCIYSCWGEGKCHIKASFNLDLQTGRQISMKCRVWNTFYCFVLENKLVLQSTDITFYPREVL